MGWTHGTLEYALRWKGMGRVSARLQERDRQMNTRTSLEVSIRETTGLDVLAASLVSRLSPNFRTNLDDYTGRCMSIYIGERLVAITDTSEYPVELVWTHDDLDPRPVNEFMQAWSGLVAAGLTLRPPGEERFA